MMSSKEMYDSVLKNRDKILKRKLKTKKMIIAVCVCMASVCTAGGAWLIAGRGEPPQTPPTGDVGTNVGVIPPKDQWDDLQDDTTAQADTTAPAESDGASNKPSDGARPMGNGTVGNSAEETFGFGQLGLIYAPDYFFSDDLSEVPATLPVYTLDLEHPYFSDGIYEFFDEKLLEYIEILYGREAMLEGKDDKDRHHRGYFDPLDPYIKGNANGKKLIVGNSHGNCIYVPLDVTAVEEYRDMNATEAYDYVTGSDYFKAGLEFLGIDEYDSVVHRKYVWSGKSFVFEFVKKSEDLADFIKNRLESRIAVEFALQDGTIYVYFRIYVPSTYTEHTVLESVSLKEALEKSSHHTDSPYFSGEYKVSFAYNEYIWDYWAGSGERFFAPYYIIYCEYNDGSGEYINFDTFNAIGVKGFKEPEVPSSIGIDESTTVPEPIPEPAPSGAVD